MKNPEVAKIIKNMSFKEKRSYIWDYYKLHILALLILIAIIVSLIYSMATKQEEYYNITYVGDYIGQDNLATVKNNINKVILNNDKKKIITLNSVFTDKASLASNPQTFQVLATKITAKDIDMSIVDPKFFEQNFSSGMFLNLETLKGFSSLKKSNYKFLTKTNSSGHLGTYGIYTKSSKLSSELGSKSNDSLIVVMATSEKKSKALKIMKALLSK
ncbi:hypothetical protein [Clostridium guangxiense]|uniref:hypothetical protein n=1 Tax=Clostridium guangxiense TaxID=1662055 RepID=UPI001E3C7489|nr:hypothetical protein [Clostridium guangxiense]MCD2345640.1 hypothetical protein [Clostridium guangxiense]